jgi:hypothetical protein
MFYDSRRTWFWVEEIEDKHLLDDTSELVFLPDDVNLPVVFKGWGVREHCKLDPTGEAVEYDPDLPPERSNKEYWGPVTVPKRFYEPVARSALGNLIVAELRKAGFHLPKHDFCHSGTASDFVWNYMHEGQNSVACGILSRHRWKLLTEKKVAVWYEGFNREHISCSPFTRRLRPNVYFLQWPEKRWLIVRPYHETLAGDAIFVDLEAGRSD